MLYFLEGIALALPTAIVPSPLKIFLISRALAYGWRPTLPATLVPLVTDGPIILLSLFVLSQVPAWYLSLLRFLGGFFILFIAGRIALLLRAQEATLQASAQAAGQSFRQALAINVFNPNPYILWSLVAGPAVLEAWRNESLPAGLGYVAGFYLAFILALGGLVLLFGTAGRISPGANRVLNGTAALVLALLGVHQIIIGANGLLNG